MNSDDVAKITELLTREGIEVWLDGGWAVDALLGQQTRTHDDLDVVIRDSDLPRLLEALARTGFTRTEGGRPFNFVLEDGEGRKVDVHTIVFDAHGNGLYGPRSADGKQEMYRAGALTGQGVVAGRAVRCVSPEFLMTYYTGYPISPTDAHDVDRLHRRFGLDLPAEYRAVPTVRPALASDLEVIRDMSFYAARWRPGQESDSKASVLSDDHLAAYVEGWGRPGDLGFIAEEQGQPVGAAWLRLFKRAEPGYGFIDPTISELSIAVVPNRRGSGIGLALLTATLAAAREAGYPAVSLSVEVDNPAQRLYERVGFRNVGQMGGAWTMRIDLGSGASESGLGAMNRSVRHLRRQAVMKCLVDVGGHRLSARTAGSGTPVVVFEAAFGSTKEAWKRVWRDVAAFTTVIVYDRAGLGESEPGPLPRTAYRIVEDLRRLLDRSHLPFPYVLVGHSFGGLIAQVFARRHPRLVSGMVLVDSTSPDQFPRLAPYLTRSGAAEADEFRHSENREHVDIPRSEAQGRVKTPFPRIPLVVLSAPVPKAAMEQFKGHEKEALSVIKDLAQELAALSPHGRLIRVERTGHFIQSDRPDVVIASIRKVVKEVREISGAIPGAPGSKPARR